MKKVLFVLLPALLQSACNAAINPGSPGAGLKFSSTADLQGAFTLTDGTINMTAYDSTTLDTVTATRSHIIIDDPTNSIAMSIYLTGSYAGSSGIITLGSENDLLRINSGTTQSTIAVNENATIEGPGSLGGAVTVASGKTLTLDLQSPIGYNIAGAGDITLAGDAVFADGSSITATGTITGGNNRIVYGEGSNMTASQTLTDVTIDLAGDIAISGSLTIGANDNNIIGNGHRITDGGGSIAMSTNDLTLSGVKLMAFSDDFITTVGTLTCNAVSFNNGISTLLVDGSITADNPRPFGRSGGGSTTWGATTLVTLTTDIPSNEATWVFTTSGVLNGGGNTLDLKTNVLNLNSANVFVRDIVLNDVVSGSITNPGDFHLSNTTWIADSGAGAVRIVGSASGASADQASAQVSVTNGLLFGGDVTFDNGVILEMLDTVTLAAGTDWTFSENSIINGNGNVLDLSADSAVKLHIAAGKTLKLRNLILKGWGSNSVDTQITWDGNATLNMADVTIIMGGDITLGSADEDITIDGPVDIITGSKTFTATTASNVINEVTVWYDVLDQTDATNVNLGSFTGGGRVAVLPTVTNGDLEFSAASPDLIENVFLNYEATSVSGRQIELDNATAFTWDGNGRTVFLCRAPADASGSLITIDNHASNKVSVVEATFDGFSNAHINDANDLIRYNNLCLLKLEKDETLTNPMYFGTESEDAVVLDLMGHDMDMSDAGAALILGEGDVDSTLTIRNGRLLNVSGSKIGMHGSTLAGQLILQDIDMVLDGNLSFTKGNLTIKGNCSISAAGGTGTTITRTATFTNSSPDTMTIDAGAILKLHNNITYAHTGGTTNLTMVGANSTIELEGATLSTSGSGAGLQLRHGTLKADNTSTLSGTMELGGTDVSGNALHVDIMPAATIDLSTGTITYSNDS